MSGVIRRQYLSGGIGLASGLLATACGLGGPGAADSDQQPAPSLRGGTIRAYFITNNIQTGPDYFDKTVIARFQQRFPQIKVEPSYNPFGPHMDKINTELAAATAPDVFNADLFDMPVRAPLGAYKNLTDWVKRDSKSFENITGAFALYRKLIPDIYGLPTTLGGLALLYNRQIFDRLGVKPPDESLAWNPQNGGPFLDLARKVTRTDQELWGYLVTNPALDGMNWIGQNNGDLMDATQRKVTFTKPETIEALEWNRNLIQQYRVSPQPADAPLTDNTKGGYHWMFLTGKLAMFSVGVGFQSNYNAATLAASAGIVKGELTVLPKGKRRFLVSGSVPWHIYGNSKQADLAFELMKWWNNDIDSQVGVYTQWGYGLPPARQAWSDTRLTGLAGMNSIKPLLDCHEKGYNNIFGAYPLFGKWYGMWNTAYSDAMNGKKAVKAAFEEIEPQVQTMIDNLPKK